jgi:hypothetical protein
MFIHGAVFLALVMCGEDNVVPNFEWKDRSQFVFALHACVTFAVNRLSCASISSELICDMIDLLGHFFNCVGCFKCEVIGGSMCSDFLKCSWNRVRFVDAFIVFMILVRHVPTLSSLS